LVPTVDRVKINLANPQRDISFPGGNKLMNQIRATNFVKVTATLFMAAMAGPLMLSAAGLSGNLSLSSHGVDTIAVNGSDIDFDFTGTESMGFPPVVTSGTVDGTGDSGLFDITAASTGSFGTGSPVAGTTVTVHDLNSVSEPVGTTTGPGLPLTTFITFTVEPGWNITLTEITPGDGGSACNGTSVTCSPAGSPFDLQNEDSATQTSGNVLVGFAFIGTESDGMGDTSAVSGTFSTTFSGTSYQAILADLQSGESIVSSADATIAVTPITAAPEPASIYMLLLGSALMIGSAAYRRHQRR
jgi:hypothetical protein